MTKRVYRIKDGQISVDYEGYTGKVCLEDADKLNKFLESIGIQLKREKIEPKPELHAKKHEEVTRTKVSH